MSKSSVFLYGLLTIILLTSSQCSGGLGNGDSITECRRTYTNVAAFSGGPFVDLVGRNVKPVGLDCSTPIQTPVQVQITFTARVYSATNVASISSGSCSQVNLPFFPGDIVTTTIPYCEWYGTGLKQDGRYTLTIGNVINFDVGVRSNP